MKRLGNYKTDHNSEASLQFDLTARILPFQVIFVLKEGQEMKVTVNVDCTPEEARTFMGLPDVQPMQQAVMAELEQQMKKNINAMSPESMVQTWLPAGMQGAESLQKMFWNQMQSVMSGVVNTTNGMLTMNNKDPESKAS